MEQKTKKLLKLQPFNYYIIGDVNPLLVNPRLKPKTNLLFYACSCLSSCALRQAVGEAVYFSTIGWWRGGLNLQVYNVILELSFPLDPGSSLTSYLEYGTQIFIALSEKGNDQSADCQLLSCKIFVNNTSSVLAAFQQKYISKNFQNQFF